MSGTISRLVWQHPVHLLSSSIYRYGDFPLLSSPPSDSPSFLLSHPLLSQSYATLSPSSLPLLLQFSLPLPFSLSPFPSSSPPLFSLLLSFYLSQSYNTCIPTIITRDLHVMCVSCFRTLPISRLHSTRPTGIPSSMCLYGAASSPGF